MLNFEIQSFSWRAINYINLKIFPKIKNQIVKDMFSYVHQHSFRFFQDNFSGSIGNNIGKLADNIETMLNSLILFIIRGVMQLLLLLLLVALYIVNPVFFVALFVWVIVFITTSIIYANRVKILSDEQAKAQSILSGKIIDSVSNTINVRLFSRENYEIGYLEKYLNILADKFRKKEWFLLKLAWVQGITITVLIAVIIFFLIRLSMNHLVTPGDFALILGVVLFVTENVWWLTEQINRLNDVIGQCNQSLQMILVPHEIVKDIDSSCNFKKCAYFNSG